MSRYVCLAAVLALSCTGLLAQSSKATADINTAVWCTLDTSGSIPDSGITTVTSCADLYNGGKVTPTADNFVTVMTAPMKVSNSQSLFVTPSLVTGLYTNTAVKSKTGGSTSTAVSSGAVYLRAVLLDPNDPTRILQTAEPVKSCADAAFGCGQDASGAYGVILDSRKQTLSQQLSDCTVSILNVGTGTCSFDLTTQLILETASAHSFSFIFPNVGVGNYTVAIQAAVKADASATSGTSYAAGAAAFGLGSMTVESVRLVHGFQF